MLVQLSVTLMCVVENLSSGLVGSLLISLIKSSRLHSCDSSLASHLIARSYLSAFCRSLLAILPHLLLYPRPTSSWGFYDLILTLYYLSCSASFKLASTDLKLLKGSLQLLGYGSTPEQGPSICWKPSFAPTGLFHTIFVMLMYLSGFPGISFLCWVLCSIHNPPKPWIMPVSWTQPKNVPILPGLTQVLPPQWSLLRLVQ